MAVVRGTRFTPIAVLVAIFILLAVSSSAEAEIGDTALTVNFPGVKQLHVYVRADDGVPGTYGGAVETTSYHDDSVTLDVLKSTYDILLINPALTILIDALDCTGATCVAPNADTDGDGLDDADELALGTDPSNADPDEDGLNDGDEVAAGTDPTNADSDGDGELDGADDCALSDMRPTVFVGDENTGVETAVVAAGCTINDRIRHLAAVSSNHGKFVSAVAKLANDLKNDGVISRAEKGAIQRAAARSAIP